MELTFHKVPMRRAIAATVKIIKRLAWQAHNKPEIKQLAVSILNQKGLHNGRNRYESAINLTDWVAENIQFWPDPANTEMVAAANRTLQLGYGDCDDMAVLLGALLMSVGIPVRFRVVGFKHPQHIYAEGLTEKGWIGLDPAAIAGDPLPSQLNTYVLEGYERGYIAA